MSITTTTQVPSSTFSKPSSLKMGAGEWRDKVQDLLQSTDKPRSLGDEEAFENNESRFEMLVRFNKEKINLPLFHKGSTIFHTLAKSKYPEEFVDVLCRYGVDFSIQEQAYGNTPLLWAVANASNEMAREILLHLPPSQAGSLNKQCREGNSALHLIVGKGYTTEDSEKVPVAYSNLELLKLAIKQGVNVNLPNKQGNTPLHLAYVRRDFAMVKLLIDKGADENYRNRAGKKPIEMLQLGKDEHENFERAKSVLLHTVHDCFVLKENDFKNPVNLQAIKQY